jgi:type I restriction enzyme S subunit
MGSKSSTRNYDMAKKFLSIREVVEPIIGGFWGETVESGSGNSRIVRNGDILESGTIGPKVPERRLSEKEIKKAKLKKDDVLITMSGNVGRVARVSEETYSDGNPFVASNFVRILRARKNILPAYLFFFLRSVQFQAELRKYTRGVAMQNLSTKAFDQKLIPDISLEEQKKIVELLEKAEILKKKRIESDEKMTIVVPALFNKMFGDIRTNNKKWPIARFGDIGESRLGKMLDAKKQTGKNKKLYIKNTNVKWGYFDLSNLPEMDFTEKEQKEFRLKSGDLLICEGGEIGRAAIWRDEIQECYFQKALHRVRIDPEKATPEYIAVLLKTMADNEGFRELIGIATIPHLTGVQLASIKLPLPPIELQHEFSEKLKNLQTITKTQKESANNIRFLFSSILSTLTK